MRPWSGTIGVLFLLIATLAGGCSRHLVIERGVTGTELSSLTLLMQPTHGAPVEGLLVELYDDEGELVTRLFSEDEPRSIPDLPPGSYTVRVDGERLDAGVLEEHFRVGPGEAIAICYEDNEGARRAWRRFVKRSGEVMVVTGEVLLVAAVVAARVSIIVLSCGCAGG